MIYDSDGDDEDEFSPLVVRVLKHRLSGALDEVKGGMDHTFLTDRLPSVTAGRWTESDRRLCCRKKQNEPM